jgi:type VI secretion system protein ImpM
VTTGAAGWHGKLPTLGDFATRRLDPAFVDAWDQWLSEGLAALRVQAGWLDAYLASPSWRFLLMPGVLPGAAGERAWVGVLMPSVDRVGRYYPLTLAHPLDALPTAGDEIDGLWAWLLRLDEAAADALHDDWGIDLLEAELARIGLPATQAPATTPPLQPAATVQPLRLNGHRHAAALFAAQAGALWQQEMHAQALWYAESGLAAPVLLASKGLEASRLVNHLFGSIGDNAAAPPTELAQ